MKQIKEKLANTTDINEVSTRKKLVLNSKIGITLISLVITIVILLILATVAISIAVDSDGLFARAQKAKEEWNKKVAEEESVINGVLKSIEPATFADADKDYFITTIKFDSEGNKIDESEGTTPKITIPAGFKVKNEKVNATISISDVENGIVIVDSAGNEFVWVPCTEDEYKKHEYVNPTDYKGDKGITVEDKDNVGWDTLNYRSYNDWTDNGSNAESVKKYGGFYIARYEAGVPENADFYVSKEDVNGTDEEKKKYADASQKNTDKYIPVSKKSMQAWNFISQINAKTVSANMYSGSSSVTSGLIDGIAWDTTVEWIAKDESLSDVVKKDSTKNGNHANTKEGVQITSDVLYAEHLEKRNAQNNGIGWNLRKNYQIGRPTIGAVEPFNDANFDEYTSPKDTSADHYRKILELSTGASEDTKLKNIYDLGGNMYEWTTEIGYHKEGEGQPTKTEYAVRRGRSFCSAVTTDVAVSIRSGAETSTFTCADMGFRVVLYIK